MQKGPVIRSNFLKSFELKTALNGARVRGVSQDERCCIYLYETPAPGDASLRLVPQILPLLPQMS